MCRRRVSRSDTEGQHNSEFVICIVKIRRGFVSQLHPTGIDVAFDLHTFRPSRVEGKIVSRGVVSSPLTRCHSSPSYSSSPKSTERLSSRSRNVPPIRSQNENMIE